MRATPGLVEILPRAQIPTREVWGIVHADTKKSARLRAVLEWAAAAFAQPR